MASLAPRKIKRYGWKPDLPDQRDFMYAAPFHILGALPNAVDLTALCPPVYDQGGLGSCTANAIAAALEFDRDKQKLVDFTPSRLFIYFNERVIENSVDSDAGAQIRDGIHSVNAAGACPESEWPYAESQFAVAPPAAAYTDAKLDRAISYARVMQTAQQMMGCLASGFPFVFGFTVYASFESDAVAASGIVPMPRHHEQIVGGHAVLAVGYDMVKQQFIVRNSWGAGWGLAGYFRMPFAYLTNPRLTSDIWTIRAVG